MNVLVVGSGGQLGTDCLAVLREGHDITGIDYPEIDISDRDSVIRTYEQVQPDVVINCAAYTAVDRCESEPEAAWAVNAAGPRHLAAQAGSRRLIHISTDYVFDGAKRVPQPYVEDDPVNPLSEYGRSKLAGEQAVLEQAENGLILRTAWLYSAHGPNFLKTMLRLALSNPEHPYTIVNDQFGSLTWSYRLAVQIERLLATNLSGIVHATSTGHSSWFEAACYFLERMGVPHAFVPCTTEDYPTPATRPRNSILSNAVLDRHGLSVFPSWQEDVDEFVGRFRERLIEETAASLA